MNSWRHGLPIFANEFRHKSGFSLGHFVDPLNLVTKKSSTGNAAWWDPFGGLSGTNPAEEAAKKALQDKLNAPVPLAPTKGEAAKNIQMMGIASYTRRMGRPSTIFSDPSPEDKLNTLLG